jgi:GT2 family glycosyltransferase
MIPVSAYIPVRNDLRYLQQCLHSLVAQSYPFAEILVIDDASNDGLEQWAKTQTISPVRYIKLATHKGLAAARNQAIKNSRHDHIAAIDADCELNKDWLAVMIKYLDDPELAGVGGQLIESESNRIPDLWRKEYLYQTRGNAKAEVDFLPGCNTLFRKQALLSIAGYDERYYFQHEDTEIGGRLRAAGWKMLYVPDAIAFHHRRDSVSSVLRRCWGYRHATAITALPALLIDLVREFAKGIKNFVTDFVRGRLRFCFTVDAVYFIHQALYSCKAYMRKDNNF